MGREYPRNEINRQPRPSRFVEKHVSDELLLTTDEAATRLRIGRSKLYDLIRANKLSTIKIGARRLVPAGSLPQVIALLLEEAA